MPKAKTNLPAASSSADQEVTDKFLPQRSGFIRAIIGLVVVGGIAVLLWNNKGLLVAAVVNGKPIWRLTLEQKLVSRYGQSSLEEMVNEQLLLNEAEKRGIVVSKAETDAKISEIEKQIAGQATLTEALAQQGMTLDEFRGQVQFQIIIEKMTAASIDVTDQEINDYFVKNKDYLTATDEASLKLEAKDALIKEKRSAEFQKIFDEVKKSAKISTFL